MVFLLFSRYKYRFFSRETQVDELAMELLLLLVILPAVQDQNHTREWLKNAIRAWCSVAAWILDLRSYLFGDTNDDVDEATEAIDDDQEENEEQIADQNNADQQQPDNPDPVQPPVRQLRDLPPPPVPNQDGLAAAHQALLQREGPVGFQPYKKPRMFPLLVSTNIKHSIIYIFFRVYVRPSLLRARVLYFCFKPHFYQIKITRWI